MSSSRPDALGPAVHGHQGPCRVDACLQAEGAARPAANALRHVPPAVVAGGAVHGGVRGVLPDPAGAHAGGELLGFQRVRVAARFTPRNYLTIFEGCGSLNERGDLCVTLATYLSTFKFCLLVWAITLVVGFAVAYFLAFHVRRRRCRPRCSCCAPCRSGPATSSA
jgi:hypothetical protein